MKSLLATALALAVLALTGCATVEGSESSVGVRDKPQYDEPSTGSRLPTRRSTSTGTN